MLHLNTCCNSRKRNLLFDAPLSESVLVDMPDNNGGFLSRASLFKRSALFSTAVDLLGTNETESPDSFCGLDRSAVGILIKSRSNELPD